MCLLMLLPLLFVASPARGAVVRENEGYGEAYSVQVVDPDSPSTANFLTGGVDVSNFLGLPCVDHSARLMTAEMMVAIQGATPNVPRPNIATLEEYLEELVVDPSNFTFYVTGVNIFKGIPDVAEYNNLAQGQVNNDFLNIERREVTNVQCSNETSDTLIVSFREEASYYYKTNLLQRTGFHEYTFAPDSHLLLHYKSRLSPTVIDAVGDFGKVSAKDMCNNAALICQGELFPYASLEECYETLGSVPHSCTPPEDRCYDCMESGSPFQGDTLQCRQLHMLSASLRPTVHCEHMANTSVKCKTEQCPASATRLPLEEVRAESPWLTPFDASLSQWFRILEALFAVAIFCLPLVTFGVYRSVRRSLFLPSKADHKGEEEELMDEFVDLDVPIDNPRVSFKQDGRALPYMKAALRLIRKTNEEGEDANVVMSADAIDIGGCKLTAINGQSGCGKSTFMKLLCGFPQPHMDLELKIMSPPAEVAYTPQASDMWPRFMRVRDILGFACTLQGCRMSDYLECVEVLNLEGLLDQTFATLSGGQQQRVHLLATMIRPKPSILFMDEPLSALDESNAVAALELLKILPVEHAFVIAIHRISPALRKHFDRILEINPTTKKIVKYHISSDSTRNPCAETCDGGEGLVGQSRSFLECLKSMFYLWHSMFWGWPALDLGAVLIGTVTAAILGAMGYQALDSASGALEYVPSAVATRIPVYMLQFIANVAALSAFVVALVYSNEDRALMHHFLTQGDIRPSHVAMFNVLRFSFYGIGLATLMLTLPLGMMDLLAVGVDTMVLNVAFFASAYQYLCYVLALAVPPLYATHLLLVTFLPMTLFTGLFFPWSTLSWFFKALHYANPVFYCLTACSHLLLATFDTNCGLHDFPYLRCASPAAIAQITELQNIGSAASQIFSAGLLVVSMLLFLFLFRRKQAVTRMSASQRLSRHESVNNFLSLRGLGVFGSSHGTSLRGVGLFRSLQATSCHSASTWLHVLEQSQCRGMGAYSYASSFSSDCFGIEEEDTDMLQEEDTTAREESADMSSSASC